MLNEKSSEGFDVTTYVRICAMIQMEKIDTMAEKDNRRQTIFKNYQGSSNELLSF